MLSPRLFAVVVGINHYRSSVISDLGGCANDARAIYGFLTQRLGVPTENIRLLTSTGAEPDEKLPSRQNIIDGWRWLIEQARTGDQLFFHYSGHGSQAISSDPNEPDGYDETLVPSDSRTTDDRGRPVYDILDKELAALIAAAEERGAKVTVVLDCCHAGSGTRALVPVRRTVADRRARPADTVLPEASRARTVASRHWSGKLGSEHVLLAGCRDEEMSHEYRSPTNGAWYGAMTHFLLQKLQELHPQMTWREVHDSVQTQVHSVYARQLPQLEGPGNRAVFGELTPHAGSYLNVISAREAGDTGNDVIIRIGGGAAVGLTPGSHVELFPAGSEALEGRGLGRGEVIDTRVDSSYALIKGVRHTEFSLPARVKVTAYGYQRLMYEVTSADPFLLAELTTAPSSPFLHAVGRSTQDGFTRFHVAVENDAYVIQDGSGVQIVEDRPPRTQAGAAKTAAYLHHLATFHNVRTLRNPSPMALMEEALSFDVQTYTRASLTFPRDGEPLGQDGVLPPGRKLWITIRNNSSENLYVTVFSLSARFGVRRIYPERAPYQLVAPGKAFFVNNIEPSVKEPGAESEAEIFKVFATRVPTSFDVLELPELNEPNGTEETRAFGPLAELMNGIRYDGPRVRNLMVQRDDTHDRWITKQVAVTALRKQEECALPQGQNRINVGTDLDITVEKPAGLGGLLVVSSLKQFSWDAEDPISLPPGLNSPEAAPFFQPLSFSHSAGGGSPGVLVLDTSAKQLSTISAESPLRIALSVENDPEIAGIAAVAFDGEYYYMVGHPTDAQNLSEDGDRRRMAVEITHLPIPDAAAEKSGSAGTRWWSRVTTRGANGVEGRQGRGGRGLFGRLFGYLQEEWRMAAEAAGGKEPAPGEEDAEVPVRDAKHAVRVLFYKLFYQKLPPDLGVRQVRLESGGTPVYSKVTSQDVSKARRALLITHGFGSSTEKLVQRALPHLKELDEYDLALTFDYETINTGIRESGLLMTAQLRRLGFGTDTGPPLDIFSHSMGTQVARVCVEMESGHQFVERVIMVGAHNTGTALAESHRLIPWLATIILNQAGLMDYEVLAQLLVIGISRLTTGIQDLAPSAELYQKLNDPRNEVDVRYYIQIGINTEMDGPINWRKLFSKTEMTRILDKALDQVLGPNDLLVGVASARGVRGGNWPDLQVDVIGCHHFEYFYAKESLEGLRREFK
ncbi:MAG: caspase family protein [Caldilineaceae bacterium]|nr:caspase family protein [Caldilineaceae bacterium]